MEKEVTSLVTFVPAPIFAGAIVRLNDTVTEPPE